MNNNSSKLERCSKEKIERDQKNALYNYIIWSTI